jgi:hypothetical protein
MFGKERKTFSLKYGYISESKHNALSVIVEGQKYSLVKMSWGQKESSPQGQKVSPPNNPKLSIIFIPLHVFRKQKDKIC